MDAMARICALAVFSGREVIGGRLPLTPVEVDGVASPVSILLTFEGVSALGVSQDDTFSWLLI